MTDRELLGNFLRTLLLAVTITLLVCTGVMWSETHHPQPLNPSGNTAYLAPATR